MMFYDVLCLMSILRSLLLERTSGVSPVIFISNKSFIVITLPGVCRHPLLLFFTQLSSVQQCRNSHSTLLLNYHTLCNPSQLTHKLLRSLGRPSNTTLRILSVRGVTPTLYGQNFRKKGVTDLGGTPSPPLRTFPRKFFFKKG